MLFRWSAVSSIAEPLPGARAKPLLPIIASNEAVDSLNLERKSKMKTSILVATIVACSLAAPFASAQERAAPARPAMSMDMDKQMPQMQQNMKAMQEQMEKIRTTTDPKERQDLLQKHMQTMQENMQAMRSMGGPMMMDGAQDGGMMMGGAQGGGMMQGDKMAGMKEGAMMKGDKKGGMAEGGMKKGGMMGGMMDGDMMKHHAMMEKRMDMMQMMMEQMVHHDQSMEFMRAK